MEETLNICGEFVVTDKMIDPYYSYQHINMGKVKNSATFIAIPGKGKKYMTLTIETKYLLRAVFNSADEIIYEPVYNKGERYVDGSYITDINYPYTDYLQYGKVCLNISQNSGKLYHEERYISVSRKGQGMTSFIACIELDDDSPVSITLRIPLSHYIYCDKASRQLKRIDYMLKVENGQIRFSDSADIFDSFSGVSKEYVDTMIANHGHKINDIADLPEVIEELEKPITVENIKPDENKNIDLEEITDETIKWIWDNSDVPDLPEDYNKKHPGVLTVENITPDENGNIDLKEISENEIENLWKK